ncbi:MAG: tetratricopeptide repeat protein, partial [Arenicella sp.]|nr:tetratricopeptide repeat protein [Arenicella sp.]
MNDSSNRVQSGLTAKDWFEHGYEYKRIGDLTCALDAFRRSIKLAGHVAAPWLGLAQVLDANGQFEDARQCLAQSILVEPNNLAARLQLANAHKNLGYVEDAEQEYRCALKINPKSTAVLFGIGQLFEDIGRPSDAANAYREALKQDFSMTEALSSLLGLSRHVDISNELVQAQALL